MREEAMISLVGAGPGDPGLITIRAIEVLQRASMVFYDALVHPKLLQYASIANDLIFVGKRAGHHSYTQDQINEMIIESALKYGHVVRLKGGDPMIFGRAQEELTAARRFGIKTQVIPGVSSVSAAPASAGIPLTARGVSSGFWALTATTVTGALSENIIKAAQTDTTVIILMGIRKLEEIVSIFQQYRDADTGAALIFRGTWHDQNVIMGTLQNIHTKVEHLICKAPGIIVIGDVVKLAPSYFSELVIEHLKYMEKD